jgi:hypothetical protein
MNFIESFYRRYAALGFSTIPVKMYSYTQNPDEAKQPLVSWRVYSDQRPTPEQLGIWSRKWPYAGIAIIGGKISNLVIVDDDRAKRPPLELPRTEDQEKTYQDFLNLYGTPEGIAKAYVAADAFIAELEKIFTATARTRIGRHFYFRPPKDPMGVSLEVPSGTGFLPGLDVRAQGGYVVAPPSVYDPTGAYVWETVPEDGIADMPYWVLEYITRDRIGAKASTVLGQKKYQLGLYGVGIGGRNDTAASVVGKLLRGQEEPMWEMQWPGLIAWNQQNSPPMPLDELRATFDSVCRKERRRRAQGYQSVLPAENDDDIELTRASTIGATTMASPGYAIEGFVLDGLTQLCGKPKAGKSFMALQIALAVSRGTPLFPRNLRSMSTGHPTGMNSCKGDVLYLALEDSERRLKDRMGSLLGTFEPFPENLIFATRWNPLFDGGLVKLDDWISQNPKTRLVVIDTVAAFVGAGDVNARSQNVFRAEYRMFRPIWELSQKYKVPILMIDHASKGKGRSGSSDVFDAGSGTLGSQAAVDTVMIMAHDDKKPHARIDFKGRDIERGFIDMEHGKHDPVWQLRPPDPEDTEKKGRTKKSPSEDTGNKVIPLFTP